MRKLFGFLAVGALLVAGGTANAASTSTGAVLAVTLPGIGSISVTGSGSVTVSGSTVTVGANLVQQVGSIVIPVTGTTAVQSITAANIANVAGTFSAGGVSAQAPGEICAGVTLGVACDNGGGIGGAMGLVGTVNVRVNAFVNIPVYLSTVGVGQGGGFVTGAGSISGDAGVWTTGQAVVNATVSSVTVPIPATGAGSPLTLVTPTFIDAFTGLALLPMFTSFTLTGVSVPEPGTLLLLASGIAGLTLVGRRRK